MITMNSVKWIKICTDIFDDEKILLIETMPEPDSLIVIWFKLLCLAGKQNNNGIFILNNEIPYTEEMLAAIFRRPLNTVRLALRTFQKYGMIQIVDNVVTIPNWEKHQNVDKLNEIRESNRQRVARYREKQKSILEKENNSEKAIEAPEENVMLPVTLQNTLQETLPVTLCNALDKDIDKDKDIDIKEKKKIKKETGVSFDDYPVLNTPEFLEKWQLWAVYKKERKEKFTDSTQKAQLGKLSKFALENGIEYALKVIDQSIENGWQGLFPYKGGKSSNTRKEGNSKYDKIAIRN